MVLTGGRPLGGFHGVVSWTVNAGGYAIRSCRSAGRRTTNEFGISEYRYRKGAGAVQSGVQSALLSRNQRRGARTLYRPGRDGEQPDYTFCPFIMSPREHLSLL